MNDDTRKVKLSWAKSLKVGDTVCDCRFKHLKIKSVSDNTVVRMPDIVKRILFSDWMPMRISDWIDDIFCKVSRKIGNVEVVDRTLVLEDGANCSAMHCCDDACHTWEHPK